MKKIAILQSNYIPWKGYFDIINKVDEFIIFDDMQYTRRDWRNRNQIKTPRGVEWLTVPVLVKGKYHQKIRDTEIDGGDWAASHWKTLKQNYQNAPYFDEISKWLEPLYLVNKYKLLSELNRTFMEKICDYLGITTLISNSWDYELSEGKSERLISLCEQAKGLIYLSGPSAKGYADEKMFAKHGIKLVWMDYSGYESYPQLWGEFTHGVTILDLLFNCGKHSHQYIQKKAIM